MEIISQGAPYNIIATSSLFISDTNMYAVRLLNKATKQYISCTAAHEISDDDPEIGILQAEFTPEQTKALPVGIYALEIVYIDQNNNVISLDFQDRYAEVRMSTESTYTTKAEEDNIIISRNQPIVSDNTNRPFMDAARAIGWVSKSATYMTLAQAQQVKNLQPLSQYSSNITNLDVLQFFTTLKKIESETFANFENLTTIVIPEGVEQMGDYVFKGCYNLAKITLPDTIYYIGRNSFEDTELYNNSKNWENAGRVLYINNHLISYADDNSDHILYVKDGIKSIASYAVDWQFTEGSIELADTIVGIGDYAFKYYGYSLTLPNSVKHLGEGVFESFQGRTINLSDKLTTIPKYTLRNSRIEQLTLPRNITTIGESAFENCQYLKKVVFNNLLQTIGNNAFKDCYKLSVINFEETQVSETGTYVFANCRSLYDVSIPQTLRYINDNMFEDCTFTAITLHQHIEELYEEAYLNAIEDGESKVVVYCHATTPPILGSHVFAHSELDQVTHEIIYIQKNVELHVPKNTAGIYEASPTWGELPGQIIDDL